MNILFKYTITIHSSIRVIIIVIIIPVLQKLISICIIESLRIIVSRPSSPRTRISTRKRIRTVYA